MLQREAAVEFQRNVAQAPCQGADPDSSGESGVRTWTARVRAGRWKIISDITRKKPYRRKI